MAGSSDGDFGSDGLNDDDLITVSEAASFQHLSSAVKRKHHPSQDEGQNKKALEQAIVYPSTSPLAITILKRQFGLESFRLQQEAVIARLISGGSAVVVFVSQYLLFRACPEQ